MGQNMNKNMAYSSKSEMTVFEIQTRDICTPPFPKRVSTIGFCLVDWSTRPHLFKKLAGVIHQQGP